MSKKAGRSRTIVKPQFDIGRGRLNDDDWKQLEKILGASLRANTTELINVANRLFAAVAPLHKNGPTLDTSKVVRVLEGWLKSSSRLRIQLGLQASTKKLEKAEVVAMFRGKKKLKNLGKAPQLLFFQHTLAAAMGAALHAIEEIPVSRLSSDLERDVWEAWVGIVALAIQKAGIKVSASSSNKGTESPFVKAILLLQCQLPSECRRFTTYESAAKGVQQAKRKFRGYNTEELFAILAGYGSGVLKNYQRQSVQNEVARLKSQQEEKRIRREK